ncbi:hypothetical protein C9374_002152 [Naegleria lovaniensis]|uniref:RBR-type E3 ubiquitin transferase n=1 Tax=Naegleria lovaniensis TaxID=51637 RepID=A0AA88KR84_NAELO|nr:uncharacterized protein C9374_002152 [Naegleria lovaniensis]KAG2387117.1 hypothetical protein C9374_002152 [Naegleria lovaniensis]
MSKSDDELFQNLCSLFPNLETDVIESVMEQCSHDEEACIELLVDIAGEEDSEMISSEATITTEKDTITNQNETTDEEEIYALDDFHDDDEMITERTTSSDSKTEKSKKLFALLRDDEILDEMEKELSLASTILPVQTKYQIDAILKFYKWNTDKLIQDYGELGIDGILCKSGLSVNKQSQDETTSNSCCESCFNENVSLIKNDICGHEFCEDCWRSYIESSISQGLLNGSKINCMAFGCNATITEEFMMSFVSEKFNEMFLKTKIDLFVANNHRLRWCVTPHCGYCIKKLCDETLYYVHCNCDAEFCFHCGEEPHFPATCEMLQKFCKYGQDISRNVEFIKNTSTQCPGCKVFISKNQGCDQMTCSLCRTRFCYSCGKQHGYGVMCDGVKERGAKFNDEDYYIEEIHTRFMYKYNLYKQWLTEQQSSQYLYNLIISCRSTATSQFGYIDSDFKFMFSMLSMIVRTRRLLKSCSIFAFFAFGLDVFLKENSLTKPVDKTLKRNVTEKKKSEKAKQELRHDLNNLKTYGSLFDSHYENLEKYIQKLLGNLFEFIAKGFDHSKHNAFGGFKLQTTKLMNVITKQTENLIDTIKRMEMNDLKH